MARRFGRHALAAGLALVIIIGLFAYLGGPWASSATYTWTQNNWSGSGSPTTYPVHPTNQTGWTNYAAKDTTILFSSGDITSAFLQPEIDCTGATDHGGANWAPTSGSTISGTHCNVATFSVASGSTVYVNATGLKVKAQTITIAGTLDASAVASGGAGAGTQGTCAGFSPDRVCTGSSGGGYGGAGGAGGGAGPAGGLPYGLATDASLLNGSVGDKGQATGASTPLGGGMIWLKSVTATVSGVLVANGQDGSPNGGGGAAGGTILLTIENLTITGTLQVKGGAGGQGASGAGGTTAGGGGGGGGRIKIYKISLSGACPGANCLVNGGAGGSSPNGNGGAGANGSVSVQLAAPTDSNLTSSAYNTGDASSIVGELSWVQNVPANTAVGLQICTAADVSGSPGSFTCKGPQNDLTGYYTSTTTGCAPSGSGTVTVTCGATAIANQFEDASNDQWIQYKVKLTPSLASAPVVSSVSLKYVINSPPAVTITNSVGQAEDGTVAVNYNLSDVESDTMTVKLFADLGATLSGAINTNSASLTVSDASFLPASGTILIDDEQLTYAAKTGNTLNSLSRGVNNTVAASHSAGANIWRLATSVTGNQGANQSAGNGKSITWTPKNEINGYYKNDARLKINANDGNAARQIGESTVQVLVIDTKDPVLAATANSGTGLTLYDSTTTTNTKFSKTNSQSLSADLGATDDSTLKVYLQDITGSSFTPPSSYADAGYLSFTKPSETKTWGGLSASDALKTVKARFRDQYGNTADDHYEITLDTTAPAAPTNLLIQDNSDATIRAYRLFTSWLVAPESDFLRYNLERSVGEGSAAFSVLTNITSQSSNYYIDPDLTGATVYNYRLTTEDNINNISTVSQTVTMTTGVNPNDLVAPTINGASVAAAPAAHYATVTWLTTDNAPSNSTVYYATDAATLNVVPNGTAVSDAAFVNSHSVALPALAANTTYYYKVMAADAVNNKAYYPAQGSAPLNFITLADDATAPTFSVAPAASNTNAKSSTIGFTLNGAPGGPAMSLIDLGTATGNYSAGVFGTLDLGTAVSQILPQFLAPATNYFAQVRARDDAGNISTSSEISFSTAADPSDVLAPQITAGPSAGTPGANSATITWTTDEPSASFVEYGTSASYGAVAGDFTLTQNHSVTLPSALTPSTAYFYRVRSRDQMLNEVFSAGDTFTTAAGLADSAGPVISNVTVASEALPNTRRVTWTTEEPSNSNVLYSQDTSYSLSVSQPAFTTNHSVTLFGLTAGKIYNYKVRSADVLANTTTDSARVFGTPTASGTLTVNPPTVPSATITDTTAVINWSTTAPANAYVEYGFDKSYGYLTGKEEATTSHSVTLRGLLSQTTYHFRARSWDASNKEDASADSTFNTLATRDTIAPVINNVQVTSITGTGATLTWITQENADSVVEYGSTQGLGSTQAQFSDSTMSHSVTLSGLTAGTLYYFQVKSRDAAGNVSPPAFKQGASALADSTFTATPDTIVPAIINVQVVNITQTGATITWTTDEAATSQVEYALNNQFTSSTLTTENTEKVTAHTVVLSGLSVSTQYFVRAKSRDLAGNSVTSTAVNFTTIGGNDTTPPVISAVAAGGITLTGATITWTTNENADSIVEYGTNPAALTSIAGSASESVTSHSVVLTGLSGNTAYYFQVRSTDPSGNAAAAFKQGASSINDSTFTTTADTTAPNISGVAVTGIGQTTATVTWTTNEDATAQVEYGTAPDLSGSTLTTLVTDLNKQHSVTLTGLSLDTLYYYRAHSKDAANNPAQSGISSFRTLLNADSIAPDINNVRTASLTKTSVSVLWDTTENADHIVSYGTLTTALNTIAGNASASTTSHTVALSGLTAGTTYYYQVQSRDAFGNLRTDNNADAYYQFTTTADTTPPAINNIVATVAQTLATITWTTDEAATSQVVFGASPANLSNTSTLGATLQTSHSAVLNNLSTGTTYYFKVRSLDAADNAAESSTQNFKTLAAETTGGGSSVVVSSGGSSGESRDTTPPIISDVRASELTDQSAVITWSTNESADSLVAFGTAVDYTDSVGDRLLTTRHQLELKNLKAGTTYHFAVSARDSGGNLTQSNDATFSTTGEAAADKNAEGLVITEVRAESITGNSAIVAWQTNIPADSQARYGITSLYGQESELGVDAVTDHAVKLTLLRPGVTYHFQVVSATPNGSAATSPDNTFVTPAEGAANVPPILAQGPIVEKVTNDSATISWLTDRPANSIVLFKTTGASLLSGVVPFKEVGKFTELDIEHRISLIGLEPDTLYQYRVRSIDETGSAIESEIRTFRTAAQAEIKNIQVTDITFDAAAISWETVEPSSTALDFGKTEAYGDTITLVGFRRAHQVKLQNLNPGTTYHFRVKGTDSAGEPISSPDIGFATLGPPKISNLAVRNISGTEVEIRWLTDKLVSPTVEYTNGLTGVTNQQGRPTLATEHAIRLNNLDINTTYTYVLTLKDAVGHTSRSEKYSFVTGQDKVPPTITQVRTENAISPKGDKIQTIITWRTDEPALGVIEYRDSVDVTGQAKQIKVDTELATNHVAVLTNFSPGRVYRFKIQVTDASANASVSREFTMLTPRQKESVIDIMFKSFEGSFGFLQKLKF